ncbi:MAG: asparagine synthase (glutamine-hydrolyzing) [Gammaproteobacteria bacterium]|nr:asparagine synthase (glutamine-hydrolyzing) [Gammaproteobacteria bacterium]MBU1972421.1 asparagine synthase (glutamine-hydrolyzing) [Gammaproteobacteria bacterium]
MCGIVGRLNFDGAPVAEAALTRARDALSSRGPDDCGIHLEGPLGLGHRRLSVLDLSPRARQPMSDGAGHLRITYNGEIYNYRELRGELERLGHSFVTTSDTEVILAAYRAWGLASLKRFNGMFAFGLWDGATRTLHLARDRIGVKPLYFFLDQSRLVFASTLRPFSAFTDLPRELDEEALGLYFQLLYIPAPWSIWRGIRKLMPGSCLSVSADGATREHAYWSLSQPHGVVAHGDPEAGLHALLSSSVAHRLVSDVPVGAFLSGGIDSSLVAALMREHLPEVRTFTIGFAEKGYDESGYARAVAGHLGCSHTEVMLSPADLLSLADAVPEHYDEPFADVSAIPTLALSRMAREHVTVALSGDGGDELLCGYPYYGHLARLDPLRRSLAPLRPMLAAAGRVGLPYRLTMGLRALAAPDAPSLFAYMRGALKAQDYASLLVRPFIPAGAFLADRLAAGVPPADDIRQRYMDLDLLTYLPDDILVKVDRASMAFGLEARNPFLDWRVVEYCRALPMAAKCPGGQPKGLAKKLLARYLPRDLIERPKMGFSVPIRAWFRGELRAAVTDAVLGGELVRAGRVDATVARHLLDEHAEGKQNHDGMLWAMMAFETWHRRNND